jgi:hypothetical protein
MDDKNFHMSPMIMTFFVIPVLLAVGIGCVVRIRNTRKLRRLITFLSHVKNTGTGHSSMLGDWMHRRKGFEKLEQYSDGENEPLDNANTDDHTHHSSDETINIESKQVPAPSMSNNVAFKMGASL